MKKINILLTLFIAFTISFWSCQQSDLPVESNSTSSSGVLNKTLDKAYLNLEVLEANGGITYNLRIHKLTSEWEESEVTWYDRITSTSWTSAGGDYSTTPYVSKAVSSPGSLQIDITSLWTDGVPPNGLLIKAATPTDGFRIKFSSREGSSAPYVQLTFIDGPSETVPVIGDAYIWSIPPWDNTNMQTFSPISQGLLYAGMVDAGEKCSLLKFPLPSGCTLTQGYWKTHADDSKKKYDETWDLIDPDTDFYHSDKSYIDILNTSASKKNGNAYIILAYQFIAAKLNMWNGASVPQEVMVAFNNAENLFNNDENTGIIDDGTDPQYWLDQKDILDDYNNGLIGPGHCDD